MKSTISIGFLAALPLLTALSFRSLAATDSPPDGPPPLPKRDWSNLPYVGVVTEVTKNSITIQWPSVKEKPKRFPVSEALAAGLIPREPRGFIDHRGQPNQRPAYRVLPEFLYRLTDVKVGDEVIIRFSHLGETDVCDHVCITKRPGGLVPPLPEGAVKTRIIKGRMPGDVFLSDFPYHEYVNAYWDMVDRGIPYPEKFGPYRRFPPAPAPREIILSPQIAP